MPRDLVLLLSISLVIQTVCITRCNVLDHASGTSAGIGFEKAPPHL